MVADVKQEAGALKGRPGAASSPTASPASAGLAASVSPNALKPLLPSRRPQSNGQRREKDSSQQCPACGAFPLTAKDVEFIRRPGRRCQHDMTDPRNRPENLLSREFLRRHIEEAGMSLRDIGAFHGYTISTLSRRAKQEGVQVRLRGPAAAQQESSQTTSQPQQAPRRSSLGVHTRRQYQLEMGEVLGDGQQVSEEGASGDAEEGQQQDGAAPRLSAEPAGSARPGHSAGSGGEVAPAKLLDSVQAASQSAAELFEQAVQHQQQLQEMQLQGLSAEQLQAEMWQQYQQQQQALAQLQPQRKRPRLGDAPLEQQQPQQLGEGPHMPQQRQQQQLLQEGDAEEESDLDAVAGLVSLAHGSQPEQLSALPADRATGQQAAAAQAEPQEEQRQLLVGGTTGAALLAVGPLQHVAGMQYLFAQQAQLPAQQAPKPAERHEAGKEAPQVANGAVEAAAAGLLQQHEQEVPVGPCTGDQPQPPDAGWDLRDLSQQPASPDHQSEEQLEECWRAGGKEEEKDQLQKHQPVEQPAGAGEDQWVAQPGAQSALHLGPNGLPPHSTMQQPLQAAVEQLKQLFMSHAPLPQQAVAAAQTQEPAEPAPHAASPQPAALTAGQQQPRLLSRSAQLRATKQYEQLKAQLQQQLELLKRQQLDVLKRQQLECEQLEQQKLVTEHQLAVLQAEVESHQLQVRALKQQARELEQQREQERQRWEHEARLKHSSAQSPANGSSNGVEAAVPAVQQLAASAVVAQAAQHVLKKAVAAFQTADTSSAGSMLRPLNLVMLAGKGGAVLQEVVARWDSYPPEKQVDVFSTVLLSASQGRWEQLEQDLRRGLAA